MSLDNYDVYLYWLKQSKSVRGELDKSAAADEIVYGLSESSMYQKSALRNGEEQPMIAARNKSNVCNVTLLPDDNMFIGDLVEVFNEKWLCVDLYEDEYGIKYGVLWLCNQIFAYKTHSGTLVNKYAIIDDGSYSSGKDSPIPVVEGRYKCYMAIDDDSRSLYVDKRLAIDAILDRNGSQILEVGKITQIDTKTQNKGRGSHLLCFMLSKDVYDEEKDNLELKVCDYYVSKHIDSLEAEAESLTKNQNKSVNKRLVINGKNSIRIGTSRTYEVFGINEDGENCELSKDVAWSVSDNRVSLSPKRKTCVIAIPFDESLIGSKLQIICDDDSNEFVEAINEVEVINIGG